ncbi:MAG: UvrD-helicase domain-containing protein, partial [Clostridia bacterium]|nr:UvrD-helicase domain-containing protein [Clostridia bacterium]
YYAVKLLQDDGIAGEIANKYEYVCVDEYQDINAVQEYVLNRVSNGKNLFMVGDVKQSIYQFRMTDPQIFLTKYKAYKENCDLGSPHSLNKNYRSSKEVIDFVNKVFNKIMTENFGGIDYRRESQLSLGNVDYEEQHDEPIRITSFAPDETDVELPVGEDGVYSVRDSLTLNKESVYQEGVYIADVISSLVGKKQIQVTSPDGGMVYRPIRFSDIALLCPKRSDGVEKIIGVLKSVGIPVDGGNILKDKFNPSVSLIIDFIKVLDNHRQDIPLVAMLTCKVFSSLTYADMAKIKREYKSEKFFCDAIEKYMNEKSDDISARLKDFFAMLDKYRFTASFMSVSALIRRILVDFDYRSYVLSGDGGESEYAGVERFIGKLEGKSYNASIAKFAQSADAVDDFGNVSSDLTAQGDFVKTSTIHASKGLEYPIVFLIDVSKQVSMRDVVSSPVVFDKNFGFAIKDVDDMERCYDDSLPVNLIKVFKTKDVIEEYMRLFYVATTRARNKLFITATTSKKFGEKYVGKPKSMWDWLNNVACADSDFMDKYCYYPEEDYDDIEEAESMDVARKSVDKATLQEFANMLDYKYEYQDATKMLVKHTVTAINNEYYESHCESKRTYTNDSETLVEILKNGDEEERRDVMTSSDEGIAYHRVLECIDYDCFTIADVESRLDNMVEDGLISKEQRDVVDANSILGCLQSEVMQSARKYPHYREKQFMLNLPADEIMPTSVKDKVLLQGTVDLFINGRAQGGENILVDFKFSRKSEKQIKERYRRQLELYATAIEECLGEKVDRKVIFILGRNIEVSVS